MNGHWKAYDMIYMLEPVWTHGFLYNIINDDGDCEGVVTMMVPVVVIVVVIMMV